MIEPGWSRGVGTSLILCGLVGGTVACGAADGDGGGASGGNPTGAPGGTTAQPGPVPPGNGAGDPEPGNGAGNLALGGNEPEPAPTQEPVYTGEPEVIPCAQDVDVMFVFDISLSMLSLVETMEREIFTIDQALAAMSLPSPPRYGLTVFVDDVMLDNNGAPYTTATEVQQAFAYWRGAVAANNQLYSPGANFSWPENSLDALVEAANNFQWRPAESTLRTIIHVTDASFWDGQASSTNHPTEPYGTCAPGYELMGCTTTGSMHTYQQAIDALRNNQVFVNIFAAQTGGPMDGTALPGHGAFRGSSVDVGVGYFTTYNGQPPIAHATGGVAYDVDAVFVGQQSLADGIIDAVSAQTCVSYPPPPVEPPPPPPPIIK